MHTSSCAPLYTFHIIVHHQQIQHPIHQRPATRHNAPYVPIDPAVRPPRTCVRVNPFVMIIKIVQMILKRGNKYIYTYVRIGSLNIPYLKGLGKKDPQKGSLLLLHLEQHRIISRWCASSSQLRITRRHGTQSCLSLQEDDLVELGISDTSTPVGR